jgi:hypothetical protein
MARPLPFTAAQHEELQQQALIYKHLVAGVPVPPELVLPIRRGLEALAARFYHNPIAGTSPAPRSPLLPCVPSLIITANLSDACLVYSADQVF